MRALLGFAIALTGAWVAVYTHGLPHDIGGERREEIDCDLWHQRRLAELERQPVTGTAAEVLVRLILGMPADLLWRVEADSSTRSTGRNSMNDTWFMRGGLALATLPLAFLIANGVGVVLGSGEFDSRAEQVYWGLSFLACPLVTLIGLWLCRARPKLGLGMVVGGVLASAAAMFWMAFVTVPVGLVIIAFAIKRSGLSIWPFRASPAGTA